jgi:hypothetical protein
VNNLQRQWRATSWRLADIGQTGAGLTVPDQALAIRENPDRFSGLKQLENGLKKWP